MGCSLLAMLYWFAFSSLKREIYPNVLIDNISNQTMLIGCTLYFLLSMMNQFHGSRSLDYSDPKNFHCEK